MREINIFLKRYNILFSDLTFWKCCVTCNVRVEVYEPLQGDVGREALDAVVRHPVLRPALGTLHLPLDIVHQALRLVEVSHVTPTKD